MRDMKEYWTVPVTDRVRGVELKPTSKVFNDKEEADEHARDIRSYVAPAHEIENDEVKRVWCVPL